MTAPDLARIIDLTAVHFGVDPGGMAGRSRLPRLVRPRQVAMVLCQEFTDATLIEIGQAFAGRGHSTVLQATTRTLGWLDVTADAAAKVEALRDRVREALGDVEVAPRRHRRRWECAAGCGRPLSDHAPFAECWPGTARAVSAGLSPAGWMR